MDTAESGDQYRVFREIVQDIRANNEAGCERLYNTIFRGRLRLYVLRQVGRQEMEDRLHDIFIIVVTAIRNGALQDPGRLMGFVMTVTRRQISEVIQENIAIRNRFAGLEGCKAFVRPEVAAEKLDTEALVEESLSMISTRDREILDRFYFKEQPPKQICREMNLTYKQYSLMKNRAKQVFGKSGKTILSRNRLRVPPQLVTVTLEQVQ